MMYREEVYSRFMRYKEEVYTGFIDTEKKCILDS